MLVNKLNVSLLFILFLSFLSTHNLFSQCLQIESILVDACSINDEEGYNEMVRFKVGPSPLNTINLTVNWPSNNWQGLVQNAATASKTAMLNADILAAGGCGKLIESTSGFLPANATVILVTSYKLEATSNSFGALMEDIYILYQNHNTDPKIGHFGNYNVNAGTRTLQVGFDFCKDVVSYDRTKLINPSGVNTAGDGAIVEFTTSGQATYINNGCSALVKPFTIDVGIPEIEACPGEIITLNGFAQGQQTVKWTATSGNFSNANALSTSYTVSPSASGTIPLTLTASNSCSDITDIVNIKIKNGKTPAFNSVYAICTGEILAALPTNSNNGIIGNWSPALDNTTTKTYTFTPNSGQCAATTTLTITVNSASTIPTFNNFAPICLGGSSPLPNTSNNGIPGTWSPSFDNTKTTTYTFKPDAGQCASETTLIIQVAIGLTMPTFTPISSICPDDTLTALPTTSNNGITGTWSPNLDKTKTKTYTFTPDAGQCASLKTLTIEVNSGVTPTFLQIQPICSGGSNPLPKTSFNNITGSWSPAFDNTKTKTYSFKPDAGQCATETTVDVTIAYGFAKPLFDEVAPICFGETLAPLPIHSTNGISGSWSPDLDNTKTTTYIFTPKPGYCADGTTLTIVVNSDIIPIFNILPAICPSSNLSALPTKSTNNITGTWSPALDTTTTKTYTFTPDVGQCAITNTLTITVNPGVIPTFDPVAPICPSEKLTDLPTTSLNNINGTWSPSLNNTKTTTYTFTPTAGQCASTTKLTIIVNAFKNPMLDEKYFLCTNVSNSTATLNCGLSNSEYSFVWNLDGVNLSTTTNTHIANQIGKYEVTATNKITNCFAATSTNVLSSSIAIANATVGEDFNHTQIITINVTSGSGEYEFQLDNGLPQSSNQFYISKSGEYEVIVRDKNGCGELLLYVTAINYPHFFTPNGDGYNDHWNISALADQLQSQIFIFDRFGKLITLIKPSSNLGWNGKYNGDELPSNDYWFVLSYRNKSGENKEFKAHFSLKR